MKKRVNIQRDVQSRQSIAKNRSGAERRKKSETPAAPLIPKSDDNKPKPDTPVIPTDAGAGEDKSSKGKAVGKP